MEWSDGMQGGLTKSRLEKKYQEAVTKLTKVHAKELASESLFGGVTLDTIHKKAKKQVYGK